MYFKDIIPTVGRVGDSPGVGHGVFADDYSAAISCTGTGQQPERLELFKRGLYFS